MTSFLRTYADDLETLQTQADVAVVMPTVLRPTLADALRSVFAQTFGGRIHVLVGVDKPIGDLGLVDAACRERPANCAVQVVYPGYSTSVRHGGLSPARDGGVLRCILTFLANSRHVAYLDDDNWWDPPHLSALRAAVEGRDWAFALRWFVHPESRAPICIDEWESVGPGRGIFAGRFGGFVDPNCLMVDKIACAEVTPAWNYPMENDEKGMSADRRVFDRLRHHARFACTGQATVRYQVDPTDALHPMRLQRMGGAYARAAAAPPLPSPGPSGPAAMAPAPPARPAWPHTAAERLTERLHGIDIYKGFAATLPEDLQGWNSVNPIFPDLIAAMRPATIIDVGVWKGGSTLYLANLLRDARIDGAVIAVDTFLGSPEHWDRKGPFSGGLRKRFGFPVLYEQFLGNVVRRGHESRVVPLPQSSDNAAAILRRAGIVADLVHIDAAHDYASVLRDAETYWDLLRPGGVLVGDDYVPEWPGVIAAADAFAAARGLRLGFSSPKWYVRKPDADAAASR